MRVTVDCDVQEAGVTSWNNLLNSCCVLVLLNGADPAWWASIALVIRINKNLGACIYIIQHPSVSGV